MNAAAGGQSHVTQHSHIRARTARASCLRLKIIIIDTQLCPGKNISNPAPRKEKKKDEAWTSLLGAYIEPVTFFGCWR